MWFVYGLLMVFGMMVLAALTFAATMDFINWVKKQTKQGKERHGNVFNDDDS